jgi:hypothetical protein
MAAKDKKPEETALVTIDIIERKIYIVRGQKVMLDSDLAALYGVETRRLNEQVKRNFARFPEDFMFQLTKDEFENLMSQIATSSSGNYGGRRKLPNVFTEQGVAMLSSVLSSERAVQVNIGIMRAFVNMRKMLSTNEEVNKRLTELENKSGEHDENFKKVFAAIRLLISSPDKSDKEIGFIQKGRKKK